MQSLLIRSSSAIFNRGFFLSTRSVIRNEGFKRNLCSQRFTREISGQKTTLCTHLPQIITLRRTANLPEKTRKSVGYWLLGCSGMVFVAVVLGGTICYVIVLGSICVVLEEIVKQTSVK